MVCPQAESQGGRVGISDQTGLLIPGKALHVVSLLITLKQRLKHVVRFFQSAKHLLATLT